MPGEDGSPNDPRFTAAIEMLERTGIATFGLRYQDDEEPIVWIAVVEYKAEKTPKIGDGAEAAAAMSPLQAVLRLCEQIMDGGQCSHCKRVCAIETDWRNRLPLEDAVCWYVYDPETQKFRRGCEGET